MSKIPKILEETYLKNLDFFKKQNPQIYNVISNITPDHSKIIINDEGKIDLTYNGRNIYGGDAIEYVEKEVEEFNSLYQSGKRITTLKSTPPGAYSSPRFFHNHLNQTIIEMYKSAEEVFPSVIHTKNGKHDFLVMMGIGLGLQISEILDRIEIQNLLILETDFELLALSCFFTNWEDIYKKQSVKKNKSITLVLLDNQIMHNEQSGLWNELIKRAPHFPYNTIFYNHGRHDKYGEIIKKINEDLKMYLSLWGFYDDESNQLNHILHNIENNIKLIPEKLDFKWNKPVIICGSGPSLDDHIEQLKKIRNKCVLISSGTSIKSILNYGLTPDFHIEIESDYEVYTVLKEIDKEITKKISLICAIQCSPFISELFKDTYAFIKDSLSIGDILENDINKLKEPTPTCVNAALSLALHYSAKEIFLFGTDFGFYKKESHHSKKSIYFESNENESTAIKDIKTIANSMMQDNFSRLGYKGDCLTTPTYYTTKRRIDMLIKLNKQIYDFKIFNCSDGLIIEDSKYISSNTNIDIKKENNKEQEYNNITEYFKEKSRSIKTEKNIEIKNYIYPAILELFATYHEYISNMKTDIDTFSSVCWAISNHVNTSFKNKNGNLMYFIRGTLWHYCFSGYSTAYSCKKENQKYVIETWKKRFLEFLEDLPKDLLKNIEKDRTSKESIDDLKKTIRE